MKCWNAIVGDAVVCLFFVLSACGVPSAEPTEAARLSEAALSQRGPRAVTVSRTDRFLLADGSVVKQPQSVAGTPIAAHVSLNGVDTTLPGSLNSDGTVTIAGVPSGDYWLSVGPRWYLTHERSIDLGLQNLGRPNAVVGTPGSALSVTASGLEAVSANDDFQLFSANAGVGFYSTISFLNPITVNAPAPGDTSLSEARFPFDTDATTGSTAFPLIDATQGDSLTISQLSFSTVGDAGVIVQALSRSATVPVTMAEGATTALSAALTPAPRVHTTLDYRLAELEAQGAEIGPGSVPVFAGIFIDANSTGKTVVAGTPDLLIVSPPNGIGNQQLRVSYGDPFPCHWSRFISTPVTFSVPYTGVDAAGAPVPRTANVTAFSQIVAEGGHQTLKPLITPPRQVTVDGQRGSQIIATSTTPTIAWQTPGTGTARQYTLTLVQVNPQSPFRSFVASFTVPGHVRAVTLPAGLMQGGLHYSFVVSTSTRAFEFEAPNSAVGFPVGVSRAFSATVLAQ